MNRDCLKHRYEKLNNFKYESLNNSIKVLVIYSINDYFYYIKKKMLKGLRICVLVYFIPLNTM